MGEACNIRKYDLFVCLLVCTKTLGKSVDHYNGPLTLLRIDIERTCARRSGKFGCTFMLSFVCDTFGMSWIDAMRVDYLRCPDETHI